MEKRGSWGSWCISTYFLTTYGEEGLVGKLVCLYFLTTYGEEGLVGKLIKLPLINTPYRSFLTTYTKE